MVDVELTDVYWLEVTVLAVVLAVDMVGRTCLHLIDLVDGIAPVSTRDRL